jgi:hypothetical protein
VYNDKGDMPPLEMFPKSQRVTFKFYEGVLLFLEENYIKVSMSLPYGQNNLTLFQAESYLNEAWQLCHKDAHAQSE